LNEIGQPVTELGQRVKNPIALELGGRFQLKPTLAKSEGYGFVCRPVLIESLTRCANSAETASNANSDLAVGHGWPEINEKAVWLEDSLGFAEGMNHAPLSQSSKRPGEDDEIKGLARELEVFGPADPIANSVGKSSRELPAGLGDETSVRVNRYDLGAQASEAKGQATFAATYLQDLLTAPVGCPP
jgi:hypothetical protein